MSIYLTHRDHRLQDKVCVCVWGGAGGEKWSSIGWVVLTGKPWWSPCISCSYHSGHIGCRPWDTLSKVEIRFGLWKVHVVEAEPALKWVNPHTANQHSLCQVPSRTTAAQPHNSHVVTTETPETEGASQDLLGVGRGAVIRHRAVQPQAQRPEWVCGAGGHVFVDLQPTRKKTYFFNWSAVDLQCYISFRSQAEWLRFSYIIDYYKMLSRVHCVIQ